MIVTVSEAASLELSQGAVYYRDEANETVALEFIFEFERTLELLASFPKVGVLSEAGIRRFPLRRFPYMVIYQVRDEEVRVIALARIRRRPDYWLSRAQT